MKSLLRILFLGMALLAWVGPVTALTVLAPSFSSLVSSAELIARVEVTQVDARWDTAPSGRNVIHTYVQFKVLNVLKGTPQDTVTLRLLGGTVGDTTLAVADMPKFQVGERSIVFVAGNGQVVCPLVGVMYGRYRLAHGADGAEHVLRGNGHPLHATAEVQTAWDESPSSEPAENGMSSKAFERAVIREASRGTQP